MSSLSFIHRILDGGEARDTSGLETPTQWFKDALGVSKSRAGVSVTVDNSLGLIPVFGAVRLLASTVGSLPLIVYRDGDNGRARARGTDQWRVLHDQPNDEQAADVLWETVMGHLNLWGNAYLEKVKLSGPPRRRVAELWPVVPGRVQVERDAQGRKRFRVDGAESTLGEDTILHIPAFGYNGLVGLSPIRLCRESLGTAIARDQYEGDFYSHDASPAGILTTEKRISPEAAKRLKEQWDALRRGDRHGTAVLEEGLSWQAIGMPLKDQQFIETAKFSVSQIALLFRVPPEMIGGESGGSLTYSNVESQALNFVKFSLRHWLVRIENALRRDQDLFPEGVGLFPEFLVEGLLRADSEGRANFYRTMVELGAYSPNDILAKENEPPRPGGDVYADPGSGTQEPAVQV